MIDLELMNSAIANDIFTTNELENVTLSNVFIYNNMQKKSEILIT